MPPTALSIRRATSNDLATLHTLLQHYYREGDVRFTETEQSLHAYLNLHPFGFFLAEFDDLRSATGKTIAGCVLFRSLESIPLAAECKRLFVLPHFRGHNIAARLMDTIEETAAPPASTGSTSTARTTSRPPSPCIADAAIPTASATTKTSRPPSFSAKTSRRGSRS
jgi:GNAT superfamily N-acetyltransferase